MCGGRVASASSAPQVWDGEDPQRKKVKAQRPEEGRMGLYEGQIKGGETKEEAVKAGKKMRELEEAPSEPLC